ncbi:Gfo/Idh/MocA family protein [Kribbella catacumbae]|uniref:Gfo/Idh/MocA family protein n=1 Tax=Kribbella catacumbae TaxID=460086 RepID=UPI00037AB302|nr:Gfo/Idh/MocA family oxidoreductase [Kribbella catacumbae]
MTAPQPVRVGFLSGVRHALPYADLLGKDARVEIVGVAEGYDAPAWVREDSEAAARSMGVRFHQDLPSLLDPELVDVLVVCSEPTRHASLAVAALEAGLPVLVDKPVATTSKEVETIQQAAALAGRPVGIVNRLDSPAVQRLRRWVDAGHLGLPLHIDAEWFAGGAHFATSVERPELVVDPALSGGGELLNFLLYPLDYIRHLTGLEVVEIYCEAATLFNEPHRASGVEDCAVVSLLLERGVTATVTLGRVPAAPGLGPVSSSLRLLGSHGHATADDDFPQVRRYDTEGGVQSMPVEGPSSVAILRRFLVPCILDLAAGRQPNYSLADAHTSLAVTEAAYRSAQLNQPVRVGTDVQTISAGPKETA